MNLINPPQLHLLILKQIYLQMKKKYWILLIMLLFVCTVNIQAQENQQEKNNLEIGGQMLKYPQVEWIKGTAITHFEKDSIYIVELWATWCVPCIMAMPHLNELNKKFKGKIIFIAQGVWEDNKDKIEQFVKKKGDELSFRVAFSGPKGSDFDNKWCLPAGVNGIPCTFVIQNNKLVWQTMPDKLSEEVLQLLVDGKFTEEEAETIAEKKH
jgi:thiol-disulfide isomerase/thioredoxin